MTERTRPASLPAVSKAPILVTRGPLNTSPESDPAGSPRNPSDSGENSDSTAASQVGKPGSIVAEGIDTLYVNFYGSFPARLLEYLGRKKDVAAQSAVEEKSPLPVASVRGEEFAVSPSGARGGWRFVLTNEDMTLLLANVSHERCRDPSNPPLALQIQFRARLLWGEGFREVEEAAREWVAGIMERRPARTQLSRIDIAVDFQADGHVLDWGAFLTGAPNTSVAKYGGFDDAEVQSIRVGKGAIVVRLYDKTAEIGGSGLGRPWFRDLWKQSGVFRQDRTVWRLEVQLRRDFLREREAGTWEAQDWLDELPGSWRKVLEDFLTLRQSTPSDSNKSRWPLHPLWVYLRDTPVFGGSYLGEIIPQRERELNEERALAQIVGNFVTYAAANGGLGADEPNDLAALNVLHFHSRGKMAQYCKKSEERGRGTLRQKIRRRMGLCPAAPSSTAEEVAAVAGCAGGEGGHGP